MFRFRKLDIFISKQFGLLFAGTFFISLFVLMMQWLWRFAEKLVGKGLSIDILIEFFWHVAMMFIPQALPITVLLSSLITYGNLGESSELTAIKASGIPLLKSFRGLIIISFLISLCSFYFQNYVVPEQNKKLAQIMVSLQEKSPELEIPEGIFYDGIPQTNLYVEHKNKNNGHLYNIMIYRMTDSYEDQAIILADSGMLQSTAEKKHLVLNLWDGEWFENMHSQELINSSNVPYRRESFSHKRIILDFDAGFNLADASIFSNNASMKSIKKIRIDRDSLINSYDSVGNAYFKDAESTFYPSIKLTNKDKAIANKIAKTDKLNIDTIYKKMSPELRRQVIDLSLSTVQQAVADYDFKSMITDEGDELIRLHTIEEINKYTLAFTCLIFFFIGASLGSIIKKGGLGIPVIISVLVYIIYYTLDNTGYRMARQGAWTIWFGKGLSPAILIPIAIFITYKANNDSAVFNIDAYLNLLKRLLGIRVQRNIVSKEVILDNPDYSKDLNNLLTIDKKIDNYTKRIKLKLLPNPIKVFFKYQPDHLIEHISVELENTIEDLSNTNNKVILSELNHYPVLITKAHTRPFDNKWMNIVSAIILPIGIFFYIRMWRFRLRLFGDLKKIKETNSYIINEINKIKNNFM